ncbi:hypothetical protein [Actinoplanes sp. NPDC026619]|uniref:hypothetical protein n=1 Tax=Actinoplanes sp. NPDC026619 TaxID=3155798 RepID=UPI0033E824A5
MWVIDGSSAIDSLHSSTASPGRYGYALVLSGERLGCSYVEREVGLPEDWVGRDPRSVRTGVPEWELALTDSMPAGTPPVPRRSDILTGSPAQKARRRAELICDLVAEIAGSQVTPAETRVVNIGVAGEILLALAGRGYQVAACDNNPNLAGFDFAGIRIEPVENRLALLDRSHFAILTAMTMHSCEFDTILDHAAASGCKVIVYGQTGHSLTEILEFGAHALVSETFPPYIFPGPSTVHTYFR